MGKSTLTGGCVLMPHTKRTATFGILSGASLNQTTRNSMWHSLCAKLLHCVRLCTEKGPDWANLSSAPPCWLLDLILSFSGTSWDPVGALSGPQEGPLSELGDQGSTPLLIAALRGHSEVIRQLIRAGPFWVLSEGRKGGVTLLGPPLRDRGSLGEGADSLRGGQGPKKRARVDVF